MFGLETVVYWNSQAIGWLIVVLLAGLVGVFLLSVEKAGPAARLLGMTFLATAMFNSGYVFAQAVLHPVGAYHRWLTIPAVMTVITVFASFFLNWGRDRAHGRTGGLLLMGSGGAVASLIYFAIANRRTVPRLDFVAAYWDFEQQFPNVLIGVFIAFYLVVLIVVAAHGITHALPGQRRALAGILVAFLVASALPSITNLASRSGQVARNVHVSMTTPLFVIGLFSIAIIYINTTTERTTFMAKIVGVSVATFLLIFQVISMFALEDQEVAYDTARRQDQSLWLAGGRARTRVRYFDRHEFSGLGPVSTRQTESVEGVPSPADSAAEARNALVRAKLVRLENAAR